MTRYVSGFGGANVSLRDIKLLLDQNEFEEEPVPLDRFVVDPYFLGMKPLSPVQKLIAEKMTQIFFKPTLVRLYGEEEGSRIWDSTVNEVICQIGKGGGKDWTLRISFARIIYLLHCLKDPLGYYNIGQGEYIDLLNIALNSDQAQLVFFDPLKNMLMASPYFQKAGFIAMSKKVEFLSRPIRCLSGHSAAEGWEGYNLIAVALDEISAFKELESGESSKQQSAQAIYDMARLSIISRFPDVGKLALLSFPRYKDDFIQRRYNSVIAQKRTTKVKRQIGSVTIEWEEDDIIEYAEPKVFAIRCPTFISNPTKRPEDFLADFIRDPVNTKARILCMPPETAEAFFRDQERLRACFHKHDENCTGGPRCVIPPFDEEGRLPPTFADRDGPPRFIHIDLGLKRDRSALCMVHCSGFMKSEIDGQIMPIIKMDVLKYWEAPPDGEIDFNDIRKFVFSLADRFDIALITLDRWNSQDTKNIFSARGLVTEYMTVKKDHYDTLSTSIYDGRLLAYYDRVLVDEELVKLQLIRGTKVDHPRTGYKDCSDALAGAVFNCTLYTPPPEPDTEIEVITYVGSDSAGDEDDAKGTEDTQVSEDRDMPSDLEDFLSGIGLI